VVAVAAVFAALFAALLARAVHLCLFPSEAYGREAVRQALHDLQITGPRGDILDRAGAPLAVSTLVPSVYARPRAIEDRARTAEGLAVALSLRFEDVFPALTGDRGFVWIRRWLAPEAARRVEALRERGVGLMQEARRYYPDRELGAHVLGIVGHDGRGLEGLERAFDPTLRGEPLSMTALRDARGRSLLQHGAIPPGAGSGRTLLLTLDRSLQYLAEEALARGARASRAKGGSFVALDPQSGEVLALASWPSFNPNAFDAHPPEERRNRAIVDALEPGSTMKPFTLATALEARAVRLSERIDCERGAWRVGKHLIRDVRRSGVLTPAEVVKYSSNICAAKIGLRLGAERLHAGLRRWFFGERAVVGLPGEAPGVLHPPERWRKSHVVTHSYGYGLQVTALQLAQAFAGIAQGGEVLKTRLVRAVLDREGNVLFRTEREVRGRAVSRATARAVARMMVGVTEKGGTGTRAAIPGFDVAGKTGTAMKVGEGGAYSAQKRVVYFAGFVPAEAPRFAAVVVLDEPEGAVTGGQAAAPVWREVAQGALRLWGVPPTREVASVRIPPRTRAPSVAKRNRRTAGPGVPDVRGLGVTSALKAAAAAGLVLEVLGSGRAVRQDPPPGRPLVPGAALRVVFARGGGG
jgi:cell division protein FtsI (penicillin-binding protein 3)